MDTEEKKLERKKIIPKLQRFFKIHKKEFTKDVVITLDLVRFILKPRVSINYPLPNNILINKQRIIIYISPS